MSKNWSGWLNKLNQLTSAAALLILGESAITAAVVPPEHVTTAVTWNCTLVAVFLVCNAAIKIAKIVKGVE